MIYFFQVWKKGRYAKDHIILKITHLTENINQLKDKLREFVLYSIGNDIFGSKGKRLKQLQYERNLWEDALLELEQQEIDKRNVQKQQEEIKRFFDNKKAQIEKE